jgi:hypothetical protein
VRTQRRAKERGFRRNQICQDLHLEHLFLYNSEKINFWLRHQVCFFVMAAIADSRRENFYRRAKT